MSEFTQIVDEPEHSTTVELVEILLAAQIASLGYPVGCGIAPHPDALRRMAEYCVTICDKAWEGAFA